MFVVSSSIMFNIAASREFGRRGKFKHVQCHGVESRREDCRRPQQTSQGRGYTRREPPRCFLSSTPSDSPRVTQAYLFIFSFSPFFVFFFSSSSSFFYFFFIFFIIIIIIIASAMIPIGIGLEREGVQSQVSWAQGDHS